MIIAWLCATALAADHELYGAGHVDGHQSDQALGVGAGAKIGYRRHLGPHTVGGSVFVGDFQWMVGTVELEAGRTLRSQGYRPWLGVEAVGWLGTYAIASAAHPDPWRGPAVSVRLAARPLVFETRSGLVVSALEVSYGQGLEALGHSASAAVTVLSLGKAW